ncbi:MAG: hypothetical protein M0Z54_13660 [Thermaerobacter sp.]|nr:hypothetical protein [Thermaerobacter sp.]
MRARPNGVRRRVALALVLLASIGARSRLKRPVARPPVHAASAHILRHPRPTAWQRGDGVLHAVWRWTTREHSLSIRD